MGTWKLGTKQDCEDLIQVLEQIKEDFGNLVGDDEVYDGLNSAIARIEELIVYIDTRDSPESCTSEGAM